MEIPRDKITFRLRTSTVWFDDEGILYSKPDPDAPVDQSNEDIKEDMEKLRSFVGNRKVCIVGEASKTAQSPRKEQRDFIAAEIESITKAMAIIITSPVSRMIANLFFSFKPPAYPVKMFNTQEEATAWIRQYL
jgi:hypothetical protein